MEEPIQKPIQKKKLGLGNIFLPLIIYFIVSFIVQVLMSLYLVQKVMLEYMAQAGGTDMTSQIEVLLEPEMTQEIMELVLMQAMDYATYSVILIAIISIPIFILFYRRDSKRFAGLPQYENEKKKRPIWQYIIIVIGGVAFCIAINNLIMLSNLAEISSSYQEASEMLYSVSFLTQLIGLGVVVPICEELLFRGLFYRRLKDSIRVSWAIIWSALLFGIFHGNIVQGIYGFLCGIIFAWIYEKYGSVKAPIFAHIVMNLVSVCLTQYEVFYWMFDDPMRLSIITVVCATLTSVCFVWIRSAEMTDNKLSEVVK